jgi:hypothetical protein
MKRRSENAKVRDPTMAKALQVLLVPSLVLAMSRSVETGHPDTMFLIPGGRPLLIEFKDGDLRPSPKQQYWHEIYRKLGYDVEVHNCVQGAIEAIALKVVAASLHAASCEISAGTWRCHLNARSRLKKDEHYSRSIQLLEEAGYSEQDARDRAAESVLPRLAR